MLGHVILDVGEIYVGQVVSKLCHVKFVLRLCSFISSCVFVC